VGSGGVLTGNVNYSATEGTDGNTDFLAGHGGAVYVKGPSGSGGKLIVQAGGVIEGNTAAFKGGGVYLETGAALTDLTNNGTIDDNGNTDPGTHTDYTALPGDDCNVAPQGADIWFNEPNLMVKFGKTTVADAFNAVHDYINNNIAGYSKFTTATTGSRSVGISNSVIHLNDYIDLPSLTVTGYPTDDEPNGHIDLTNSDIQIKYDTTDVVSNQYGTVTKAMSSWMNKPDVVAKYKSWYQGKILRIIVVGVNSFNGKGANGAAPPHIVFQFQNLPGYHAMNSYTTNVGGYKESTMRAYLVPVDGKAGSGNYLTGLENAGVPDSVLWAPKQVVGQGGDASTNQNTDTLEDKLFLPTENEVFGNASDAYKFYNIWHPGETHGPYGASAERVNAPVFEFYTESSDYIEREMRRLKYHYSYYRGNMYWLSSASTQDNLCYSIISNFGETETQQWAYYAGGYGSVPAFCVK
jgi:hypothetical protein